MQPQMPVSLQSMIKLYPRRERRQEWAWNMPKRVYESVVKCVSDCLELTVRYAPLKPVDFWDSYQYAQHRGQVNCQPLCRHALHYRFNEHLGMSSRHCLSYAVMRVRVIYLPRRRYPRPTVFQFRWR
jgi:hypothetical protein